MSPRTFRLAIVIAVAGITAVVWSARYAPWVSRRQPLPNPLTGREQAMKEGAARWEGTTSDAAQSGAKSVDPEVELRPAVANQGSIPMASVNEQKFDFGRMQIGDRKSHHFRIDNKGNGPLVIAKGPTECKCTISRLSGHEIPPGGFADVEIAWAPLEADPTFEKSAIIWTNDPKHSEIRFRIAGRVGRSVVASPTSWHAGTVTQDQEGKATGIVVSETSREFKILSVTPPDPNVKVSYRPMSASALTRVGMPAGYEFTAVVGNGIPIGSFRSHLKILTSLDPKTPIDVELTAVRPGPIRILSAANARWDPGKALLNLGRFRHETGFKAGLTAFVYDMPGPFRVVSASSSDSFVKVSVESNPGGGATGAQGVRFVFEVAPGSPPVNHFTQRPAHVTVLTNHPTLKKLDFDLQFVSM
jgi:hypothetical protein